MTDTDRNKPRPRRKRAYKPFSPDVARLKAARIQLGTSQDAVAMLAGMSVNTIRRIENTGRAWPRQINALRGAIRTLQRRAAVEDKAFPT